MATAARRRVRTVRDVPVSNELSVLIAAIKKDKGESAIVAGSEKPQPGRIPTGIFTLDFATLGGFPESRISMVHGPKHGGKTTLSSRLIRGVQRNRPDDKAVLEDIEGAYDSTWAGKIGVDNDELLVTQPDTGEEAVDTAVGLVHAREVSLLVIDSVAALLPHKEQEASAEDTLMGQQSRLVTSMLRKLSAAQITERKRGHIVSILLINQQRAKIGGYAPPGMELTSNPGGKAIGFFTSLEMRTRSKELMSKDDDGMETLYMNEHSFTIEKNRLNAGMRSGEFGMMRRDDPAKGLSEGDIDNSPTLITFAQRAGIYTGGGRGGFTLSFDDYSNHFDNKREAELHLNANPDEAWMLRCYLIAREAERQGMPDYLIQHIREQVW